MIRALFRSIIIVCLCVISRSAPAQSAHGDGLSFYAAAGPNFVFPTSARVGWGRWEFGLLSRGFLGLNKTFPAAGSSIYSSFGFGINADGFAASPGLQTAVGFSYDLFGSLGLRAEILANANLNGDAMAHALVGISYGF